MEAILLVETDDAMRWAICWSNDREVGMMMGEEQAWVQGINAGNYTL